MNICIVADVDLSKPHGNTIKVVSTAVELNKHGHNVCVVATKHSEAKQIKEADSIETHAIPPIGGSVAKTLRRNLMLVSKGKEIKRQTNSILHIETSPLGGYFALAGVSNYVLGVHGIYFDELRFARLPRYLPLGLYQKLTYFQEKLAVRRASRIVAVSTPMKEFIVKEWNVPPAKVEVVHNGYFASKVEKLGGVPVKRGMISFVGVIARWAVVDKIVEAAYALRHRDISFYIVGDGQDRGKIEEMVKKYDLKNVIMTGVVPIDKSYEIMSSSEILLAPFPRTLALEVASPIKLMEYMALGKPMVVDDVGEIPSILKKNDAALVSDPLDQKDFTRKIEQLLDDEELKHKISSNAKKLSSDFSWEKQGERLSNIYRRSFNNMDYKGMKSP